MITLFMRWLMKLVDGVSWSSANISTTCIVLDPIYSKKFSGSRYVKLRDGRRANMIYFTAETRKDKQKCLELVIVLYARDKKLSFDTKFEDLESKVIDKTVLKYLPNVLINFKRVVDKQGHYYLLPYSEIN